MTKLFVSIPYNTDIMQTLVDDSVKKYLEERFDVSYSTLDRQLKPEEIVQYISDADVIMIGWSHAMITRRDLENTQIKLIV